MNRRTLLAGGAIAGVVGIGGVAAVRLHAPDLLRNRGTAGDPVRTDTVTIPDGWRFSPDVIEVSVDTTVTWINNGAHDHTVTFDEGPVEFDEDLAPGERTRLAFDAPGTFDYYCAYHRPDMVGTVIVTEE